MKRPDWKELKRLNLALNKEATDCYLRVLALVLNRYSSLGGDTRGLGYLRSRDFASLYSWADSLSSQGNTYDGARNLFFASQVTLLIKKYPWVPSEIGRDPEAMAVKTFFKSERKCELMNRKFRLLSTHFDAHYETRTKPLRQIIRSIIGRKPEMARVFQKSDFGSGASIGVHGRTTHLGAKYTQDKWTVTPCALPFAYAAVRHNAQLMERFYPTHGRFIIYDDDAARANFYEQITLVPNNKIVFVPKTAKTHRVIAIEPTLNTFLQKGTDLLLREKLMRIGINLKDQSINQEMARNGSILDDEESFVTIDLSSASDSISMGLCRHLLPPVWFDFLSQIRSPSYELSDSNKTYHKFCSMGNGFCFPLETLLFVSICIANNCGTPGRDFHVYGDDIIVRKKYAESVLKDLKYYGFTPNWDKTFINGPFRESCGADWYEGKDVRPYTLDNKLDSLESLFKFINLSRRNTDSLVLLGNAIDFVIDSIPPRFRFHRPFKGTPESGIDPVESLTYPLDTFVRNKRYQCWSWFELSVTTCYDRTEYPPWVCVAAALRNAGNNSGAPSGKLFSFRRMTKTRVRLVARSGNIT